ncbi:MAG: 2-oxoacid:acceptor oxidoreductase family protein [Chloroflexota bacterium]
MELKIIIAGIGGQGVVYATKVLSQAALLRGEKVMASENHGMSQRGGSVMSHVKIGGGDAPLIRRGTADFVIGFDATEAVRNLPYVRGGGHVFVNSADGLDPAVAARLAELGIGVHTIHADACAHELKAPAVTNLAVLGFVAAHPYFGVTVDDLRNAVRALGPAKAVELNLKSLDLGAAQIPREASQLQTSN